MPASCFVVNADVGRMYLCQRHALLSIPDVGGSHVSKGEVASALKVHSGCTTVD